LAGAAEVYVGRLAFLVEHPVVVAGGGALGKFLFLYGPYHKISPLVFCGVGLASFVIPYHPSFT
jgi:hypothetical protein